MRHRKSGRIHLLSRAAIGMSAALRRYCSTCRSPDGEGDIVLCSKNVQIPSLIWVIESRLGWAGATIGSD